MPASKHVNIDETVIIAHLEVIKSSVDIDCYLSMLCDLILQCKTDITSAYPSISENIVQISQYKDVNNMFDPMVQDIFMHDLYRTWKRQNKEIPDISHKIQSCATILAWGYGLKCNGTKSIKVYDLDWHKFSPVYLKALWVAIEKSGLESLVGIKCFDHQSPDAWRISCQGLANSHLTSIDFDGRHYLTDISIEMWQLFWDAIKASSITHLDLSFMQVTRPASFPALWVIMCDGLKESKVRSLSLVGMGLDKLNRNQWSQLYVALAHMNIQFLNLSCNHLYGSSSVVVHPEASSWDIICRILSLSSLTHLRIRDDYFNRMTLDELTLFCRAISQSHLDKLDLEISDNDRLPQEHWLMFIAALRPLNLTSLTISHYAPSELSSEIISAFCEMIENSSLNEFALTHLYGLLSLSYADWKRIGNAFQQRAIKSFDFGSIKFTDENVLGLTEGLLGSGIDALHMQRSDPKELSPASWQTLSAFIKKAHIKTLDLSQGYPMRYAPESWRQFCDFIVQSEIMTLYFDVHFDLTHPLEMIQQFCDAIKNSRLKTLELDFYRCHNMELRLLSMIFDAINKSGITELLGVYGSSSQSRQDMMSNTLRIVNNRAKYKNTLFGLCATTLFQKYHAELTLQGIRYGADVDHQQKDELGEGPRALLQKFS